MPINGHGHSSPTVISTTTTTATTTLVGAQRRKSKVAHRINIEDKVNEATQVIERSLFVFVF